MCHDRVSELLLNIYGSIFRIDSIRELLHRINEDYSYAQSLMQSWELFCKVTYENDKEAIYKHLAETVIKHLKLSESSNSNSTITKESILQKCQLEQGEFIEGIFLERELPKDIVYANLIMLVAGIGYSAERIEFQETELKEVVECILCFIGFTQIQYINPNIYYDYKQLFFKEVLMNCIVAAVESAYSDNGSGINDIEGKLLRNYYNDNKTKTLFVEYDKTYEYENTVNSIFECIYDRCHKLKLGNHYYDLPQIFIRPIIEPNKDKGLKLLQTDINTYLKAFVISNNDLGVTTFIDAVAIACLYKNRNGHSLPWKEEEKKTLDNWSEVWGIDDDYLPLIIDCKSINVIDGLNDIMDCMYQQLFYARNIHNSSIKKNEEWVKKWLMGLIERGKAVLLFDNLYCSRCTREIVKIITSDLNYKANTIVITREVATSEKRNFKDYQCWKMPDLDYNVIETIIKACQVDLSNNSQLYLQDFFHSPKKINMLMCYFEESEEVFNPEKFVEYQINLWIEECLENAFDERVKASCLRFLQYLAIRQISGSGSIYKDVDFSAQRINEMCHQYQILDVNNPVYSRLKDSKLFVRTKPSVYQFMSPGIVYYLVARNYLDILIDNRSDFFDKINSMLTSDYFEIVKIIARLLLTRYRNGEVSDQTVLYFAQVIAVYMISQETQIAKECIKAIQEILEDTYENVFTSSTYSKHERIERILKRLYCLFCLESVQVLDYCNPLEQVINKETSNMNIILGVT